MSVGWFREADGGTRLELGGQGGGWEKTRGRAEAGVSMMQVLLQTYFTTQF